MALIKKIINSIKNIWKAKPRARRRRNRYVTLYRFKKKSPQIQSRRIKKVSSKTSRPRNIKRIIKPKLKAKPKRNVSRRLKAVRKHKPRVLTPNIQEKFIFVGKITHYFSRIQVVVIKMLGPMKVGDEIYIKGGGKDFKQKVKSIQIESVDVKAARKGQVVGLKVEQEASVGSKVYKII